MSETPLDMQEQTRTGPISTSFIRKGFLKRWQTVLGLVLILIFVGLAISADIFTTGTGEMWTTDIHWEDDPNGVKPHPPDGRSLLGTIPNRYNHKQLDVFTVLMQGSKSALIFGLTAALITSILGTILGAASAWAGGPVNDLIMRITDAMLTIPIIIGVVLIQQIVLILSGNASMLNAFLFKLSDPSQLNFLGKLFISVNPMLLGLILFSWMPYARLTNTMVMRVREAPFVQAAKALGASGTRILFQHLIPNSISPTIIHCAKDIGGFVILQATFTFIGLGSESEWGSALAIARDYIIGPGGNLFTRWWTYLPITLALVLFGIGWNLLGDGLNDWLSPKAN